MISEMTWVETCPKCQTLFKVDERGGGFGKGDREDIDCPKCKHVLRQANSSGVFLTQELTDEEIQQYNALRQKRQNRRS